jgi:hypothetical protein
MATVFDQAGAERRMAGLEQGQRAADSRRANSVTSIPAMLDIRA